MSSATCHIPTEREQIVTAVYSAADAVIAGELSLLRGHGVRPRCQAGCSTCCAQLIVTNRLEVHAIGQYLRRHFTPQRLEALRLRVLEWNRWEEAGRDGTVQPAAATRRCPLLEGVECSVYPVRPLICRAHFVSTDPAWCRPALDVEERGGTPRVLESVRAAAAPFKHRLAVHVDRELEAAGLPREESVALLPPGLAEEMEWE
jgi:Fe-S-cluster containining protein